MRLTCPGCQTEYDVPDAALAGRQRKLRCGACSHEWPAEAPPSQAPVMPNPAAPVMAGAEADVPAVADEVAIPMAAAPVEEVGAATIQDLQRREALEAMVNATRNQARAEKTEKPPKKQNRGWPLSILIVLLAVAYVLLGRESIMKNWPPSIRFYQSIGLG